MTRFYPPNENDSSDRRRREVAAAISSADVQFMTFRVASNITPATDDGTGITPTQFTVMPTYREKDTIPDDDEVEDVRDRRRKMVTTDEEVKFWNYDVDLSYTLPLLVKRRAFGLAVFVDGDWIVIWIGC